MILILFGRFDCFVPVPNPVLQCAMSRPRLRLFNHLIGAEYKVGGIPTGFRQSKGRRHESPALSLTSLSLCQCDEGGAT